MLGLGVLASSGAAIIEVADTGKVDEAKMLDAVLLLSLRMPGDPADPIGARWVEEAARDFTGMGGVSALTFVVAGGGAALLGIMLKSWFDRPRLDLVPHAMRVFNESFPSDRRRGRFILPWVCCSPAPCPIRQLNSG